VVEVKLGIRKVSKMNFSKIVTLPKPFTENYLKESNIVEMTMTPDGRLTLKPVHRRSLTEKRFLQK